MAERAIKVAVFPIEGRSGEKASHYTAYTLWFDASWRGICLHDVTAASGAAAKKLAIADHVVRCRVARG